MSTYTLIGLTVLIAAFVQGFTGLGFALISGPVIGMVSPRLLPVFLLMQMIPLNGYVAWRERHRVGRRGHRLDQSRTLVRRVRKVFEAAMSRPLRAADIASDQPSRLVLCGL